MLVIGWRIGARFIFAHRPEAGAIWGQDFIDQNQVVIFIQTKFEFGVDASGELMLIDEVLTPDSSRFWPESEYQIGISPPSFDKQFVRDYLETLDWDKTAPGPSLPAEIAVKTAAKYREALERLTS